MKGTTRVFLHRYALPRSFGVLMGGMALAVALVVAFDLPVADSHAIEAAVMVVFGAFFAWGRIPIPRLQSSSLTGGAYFQRTRARVTRRTVFSGVLGVVLVTFHVSGTTVQKFSYLAAGAVVMAIVVGLLTRNRLRCPRCGCDFTQERAERVARFSLDARGAEQLWDACPHCDVRFNEPYRPQ